MGPDFEREVMQRAVDQAKRGRTSPNPRVGAAIVRDGAVLSTGFNAKAGEAHAEVAAIRNADGSVETGRFSFVHLCHPPLSTDASSNPIDRSIHQTRVAHIVIRLS